ncbi:unnamed protein product [Orchesella dallaii]|uniref:Uncharacterized protein n=1 Tax=Orchesella dallaii TaxID=48710 RepID=A0ABP1S259_9HEXA
MTTTKVRRQEQEESGKEHAASSSTHSEGEGTKTEDDLSPFEQAFKNLTTPDQLVPIINDLTLITLIILHLPAIVPTILIPLAFFGVGALLIPFVRINYFINHKDDDEDGRQLTMGWLENILSYVTDKMW